MNTDRRIPELDIMRFFAAVSVLLYHYTYFDVTNEVRDIYGIVADIFRYGGLGVQLFFMISGFVIFWSASNRTAWEFAISRLVRLYPAYWFCATLTALGLWIANGIFPLKLWAINLTMVHQILGFSHLDGSYWTLTHEIIFYGITFLLIVAGLFRRAEGVFAIILMASLAYWAYQKITGINPPIVGTLLMLKYAPYFISGGFFYLCAADRFTIFRSSVIVLSWIIALFNLEQMANEDTFLKLPVLIVLVSVFYCIFYGIAARLFTVKPNRVYELMGLMTYPLYLLHQVLGKLLFEIIGFGWWQLLSISLLFLLLAYGVNLFIEKPLSPVMKNLLLKLLPQPANPIPEHT